MAIHFLTSRPETLLNTFKDGIKKGHVVTWSCDDQGDFTHAHTQWAKFAWLRPSIKSDRLVLNIIRPKDEKVSTEVYAIYHGRFVESMLAHCDKLFVNGIATAMPESGDLT